MSKKNAQENSVEIFTGALAKPADVEEVLKKALNELDAENVRFRLRSWDDRSVVYVPNWMVTKEADSKGISRKKGIESDEEEALFRLEVAEPELAERVYYDSKNNSIIDCIVGLVARIARIKEEEMKGIENNSLLADMKKGIEDKIDNPKIRFSHEEKEGFKEFVDFTGRLEEKTRKLKIKKKKWEEYLRYLRGIKEDDNFFGKAFCEEKRPWEVKDKEKENGKGDEKERKKAEKRQKQWKQLQAYLEEHKKGNEIDEFLMAVQETLNRYSRLQDQYEKYTSEAKSPSCEIVVPVVAFGKFIGVLNFHRRKEFSEEEEYLAKKYAVLLAVTYLQWQAELFEDFQKVAQAVTAENNFEVIASRITDGIRKGLSHGLQEYQVFPILYIPKRPIDKFSPESENYKNVWEDTYQSRRKPKDEREINLWETEEKLGPIPIRLDGLGGTIIKNWAEKMKKNENLGATDQFTVCLDADDPNSESGSRSALYQKIKTTGCLPLMFEDKVYGLLYLHCEVRHFFTEAELNALRAFGTQAAIAINNAELTGDSYEKLYGSKLLDFLMKVSKNELL